MDPTQGVNRGLPGLGADLDDANPELLVDDLGRAGQLVLGLDEGKIYWGAQLWNRIYKLPDGGGNADVVEVGTAFNVVEIAIDGVDEKLYWVNDHSVYQVKLDGSGSVAGWWVCSSNDLKGMALLK